MSDQARNHALPRRKHDQAAYRAPLRRRAAAPKRILYVLSMSGRPTASLYRALAFSRLLDSELHVLCVVPDTTPINVLFPHLHAVDWNRMVDLSRSSDALTREWLRDVLGNRLAPGRVQVRTGHFLTEVAAQAAELDAGLIVTPPGMGRFGSLIAALAQRTDVPVLVARPCAQEASIVAATDLRDAEYPVLRTAAELGAKLHAPVIAVHNVAPFSAAPNPGGMAAMVTLPGDEADLQQERLSRASLRLHLDSEAVVAHEPNSAEAILFEARSRDADIIVVGTRARSGVGRLLSPSVAAQVVDRASRSVLVTPLYSLRQARTPSMGRA